MKVIFFPARQGRSKAVGIVFTTKEGEEQAPS